MNFHRCLLLRAFLPGLLAIPAAAAAAPPPVPTAGGGPPTSSTIFLNVRDFGARGDSTTDDTAAFQKALDACGAAGGGTVFVPNGRYLIRTHLNVPPYVTLQGTFAAPPATTETHGSTLLAVEGKGNIHAEPFLTLNRCSTLRGLQVFYPEQDPDQITPYPWCIRGHGDNVAIRDVLLVNPYMAVDFGTFPAGRHFISGLYAHALKTGLFIDKCFDVGRVENVHFWPFWGEKAMKWTVENGTAFIIARTDWQYMTNCFAIAYKVGFHFVANADGPGNAVLTQCGSDIGPLAVRVDAVQPHAGVSFVNGQMMATVEVSDTNMGPVKFTACGFWGTENTTNHHALIRGGGHVTFTACHFENWALVDPASPAIIAKSGSVTVTGCEFLREDPRARHIELWEDVEAAIITGNRFRTAPKIENRSEGEVEISGNVGGRPPALLSALDRRDADEVARLWEARMKRSPLTSHSVALRLASAQGLLESRHGGLRRRLLESVVNEAETPATAPLIERARDELRLDAGTTTQGLRPTASARRTDAPPVIDGKLEEPAWSQCATEARFPGDGEEGGTGVRLLWDDEALYLGARMEESRLSDVKATVTNRDGPLWLDDCLEFFVAPGRTTHRYLQMIINAAGVHFDGVGLLRGTNASLWNASPRIATGHAGGTWTVEMRLPWKELGAGPPRAGEIWTADFRRFRYAGGPARQSNWSGAPLGGTTHHPEQFGFLVFE